MEVYSKMAKVLITDTILRDAHQSQAATRMTTAEMLPIAAKLDKVGYWSLEMWGGATFDSCMRYLNEDPWERLRKLRRKMPNTRLQMLLRGQNILGYRHYPDDVVEAFVERAAINGIDVFRIFDALNDIRNMEKAFQSVKRMKQQLRMSGRDLVIEGSMCYTTSPVHTMEYFIELGRTLEQMGADTICIKDMANLLLPYTAYELITKMKRVITIPIHLHTHNTAGTGDMILLKAIEAGVDIVDTALSPLGNGTSQPATEPLVATLQGTPFDTGLDLELLTECSDYFRGVADRLKADGFLNPKVKEITIKTLKYQVPGGMLSNLLAQLKEQGAEDKYEQVLEEVPKVRADFGYPPLVTPSSQIVGSQALLNVLSGERYKMVTNESKAILRGEYGLLPGKVDPELRKRLIGDAPVKDYRPADDLEPEMDKHRNAIKEYMEQEEDVLSYALFPPVAENFFKYRAAQKYKIDNDAVNKKDRIHPIV